MSAGVVGPTGAGKTTMTETLAAGLSAIDVKHVLLRMNPKAITAPQMFGKMVRFRPRFGFRV